MFRCGCPAVDALGVACGMFCIGIAVLSGEAFEKGRSILVASAPKIKRFPGVGAGIYEDPMFLAASSHQSSHLARLHTNLAISSEKMEKKTIQEMTVLVVQLSMHRSSRTRHLVISENRCRCHDEIAAMC
jgi:predicted chitinase